MTELLSQRRYDPYYCRRTDELKVSPRRTRRKQSLNSSKNLTSKLLGEKCKKKSCPQSPNLSKIGKYVLTKKNVVTSLYNAYHTDNQREYTCRVIEIGKYREFVTPYYLTQDCEHVNRIEEIILGDQFAYIFFENSYGDLHTYVRSKRKLKEDEACVFYKQIVGVVEHCHSNGLVLRDLKLRKFVFKDKARTQLKLLTLDDASIIKNESDILFDKHGCPAYVSPEILESNTGYSSKAADIWSLGVIIFTMLCGRYPFHEQDPIALFTKIKNGTYIISEPLSPKARCLIYSILRKNPSERLTAEELLEHPWFNSNFTLALPNRQDRKRCDQLVPDMAFQS